MAAPTAPPPRAKPPPTRAPAVLIAESSFAESAITSVAPYRFLRSSCVPGFRAAVPVLSYGALPARSVRPAQLGLSGLVVGCVVQHFRRCGLFVGMLSVLGLRAHHAVVDDGQQREDEGLDEP